jgi:hypothetical protein
MGSLVSSSCALSAEFMLLESMLDRLASEVIYCRVNKEVLGGLPASTTFLLFI